MSRKLRPAFRILSNISASAARKKDWAPKIFPGDEGVGGVPERRHRQRAHGLLCKVAQPHFQLALDVLADMILHSRFEKKDIEKRRKSSLKKSAWARMPRISWWGWSRWTAVAEPSPRGVMFAGTNKSVEEMSRELMLDYMAMWIFPGEIRSSAIAGKRPAWRSRQWSE